MRRLSRSIFVLCVFYALNASTLHARPVNDDGNPRGGTVPRIVKVIKKIIRYVYKPSDGGNLLIPPNP